MLGTIVLLVWSLTLARRCHLVLLGKSQNSILLLLLQLKKRSEKVCSGNGFTLTRVCREMKPLLLNDIELSWKLHLLEHLFQIFTYNYGIVVTF